MEPGLRMRVKRTELKRGPKDVANALNVSESTYRRMERESTISAFKIPKICEELKLTPNELFSWEDE